jgi:predicted ribosomally synthesized peptide with nif11-like leader
MKSLALRQFLLAVAADQALQTEISTAKDLAQMKQLAQTAGFAITAKDLQLWAKDEAMTSPCWTWAEGSRAHRKEF